MPKGIPNKKTGKRKYTKRAISEMTTEITQEAIKSRKQEIIEHLESYHVKYTDMDGHLCINQLQMVNAVVISDLVDLGIQAMNARVKTDGTPYIALYY
jgi:hypothetical protein